MGEILWEETGPKARLKATVARYETAMREALNVLEIPLPAGGSISDRQLSLMGSCKAATVLLCAALSDQPAEAPAESKLEAKCERRVLEARIDEHAKTCGDCNETNLCDDMLELRRWLATLSDQPAEEPAESKLEAQLDALTRKLGLILVCALDWFEEADEPKERDAHLNGVAEAQIRCGKQIMAILDAQPSTPEPKGE